jgi:hypothetical protein
LSRLLKNLKIGFRENELKAEEHILRSFSVFCVPRSLKFITKANDKVSFEAKNQKAAPQTNMT